MGTLFIVKHSMGKILDISYSRVTMSKTRNNNVIFEKITFFEHLIL